MAVYPGLVNAHDHVEFNHYPRTKFRPVYADAADWAADFTPHLSAEPFARLRRVPLAEQCRIGADKNLHAGVTTVAHHNPPHRALWGGRWGARATWITGQPYGFPVRVLRRYGWAHSFALERRDLRTTFRARPRGAAWFIHLAEGTGPAAAAELGRLAALGLLRPETVLIHGVGLSAADRRRAIEAGAGLVWCPSSNYFLLGQTAQVGAFAEARRLALGTDSRLTADGDMFDELRAAYATDQIAPRALFRAVTTDAARLIRAARPGRPAPGSLLPGCLPDFFLTPLTPTIENDPCRALIGLHPPDLREVWLGGVRRI
jgi:cytosine/adenosine deaminase-related metal-dependent hydrolase